MPFGIEPDHLTVGFSLLVGLPEVMQGGEILKSIERPRIEGNALAFFTGMIAPAGINSPVHPTAWF